MATTDMNALDKLLIMQPAVTSKPDAPPLLLTAGRIAFDTPNPNPPLTLTLTPTLTLTLTRLRTLTLTLTLTRQGAGAPKRAWQAAGGLQPGGNGDRVRICVRARDRVRSRVGVRVRSRDTGLREVEDGLAVP